MPQPISLDEDGVELEAPRHEQQRVYLQGCIVTLNAMPAGDCRENNDHDLS